MAVQARLIAEDDAGVVEVLSGPLPLAEAMALEKARRDPDTALPRLKDGRRLSLSVVQPTTKKTRKKRRKKS